MKLKKEEIGTSLFECLIEIILTLILCAVGFGLCYGLGAVFRVDLSELDFDFYALIGIVVIIVIGIIIGKTKESLRKHKNCRETGKESPKEVTQ